MYQPIINNVRFLKLEDTLNFSGQLIDELAIDTYDDNEHLQESSYIICDILFRDKLYVLVHGFPGDNPVGAIFNHNETYIVGEGGQYNDNIPENWYDDITEHATNYNHWFWTNELKVKL